MRIILFTTLLLCCFIINVKSQRGNFEFNDSSGRCWRCLPEASCIRCPDKSWRPRVPNWDRSCQRPSEADCKNNPFALFPSRCRNFFYRCENDGYHKIDRCPGETVFDMRQQVCVPSDELTSIACDEYLTDDQCIFGPPNGTPPTTTTSPDNGTSPTTTISPDNGTPTPTGDPDPDLRPPTLPPGTGPCTCVPWFPCRCNPCWQMPCRSCNGCPRMMG